MDINLVNKLFKLNEKVMEGKNNPIPCTTQREIKVNIQEVCPHCKEVIHEKELYNDGKNWFHRPCMDKGSIEILKSEDFKAPDVMKELQEVINIQGANGNWNNSEYMLGLYNGLIVAKATLKGDDETIEELRSAPEEWLEDRNKDIKECIKRQTNILLKKAYEVNQ